jgi:hypothetical protein
LADAQSLLNFPTLRDSRMKHRYAEILLQRFDNIENTQLAALEINSFGTAMPQE